MEQSIDENTAQTVGELLRNARLKRGMTLSDVSADLCIRKSYLNAIENMDFANIPPMPFGIGFVRSYADYMGLNSDRIVSSYRQALEPQDEKQNIQEQHEDASVPQVKHLLLALLGFLILFGFWHYRFLIGDKYEEQDVEDSIVAEPLLLTDESEDDATSGNDEAISIENITDIGDDAEKGQSNTDSSEAKIEQRGLKIVLSGPSWLELKQGDKVLLSGTYKKGFSYEIAAEKGQRISVGRPYNVKFYAGEKQVNVASSMKKADIDLDQFLIINETDQ